jgi:hypothetical protein
MVKEVLLKYCLKCHEEMKEKIIALYDKLREMDIEVHERITEENDKHNDCLFELIDNQTSNSIIENDEFFSENIEYLIQKLKISF